MASPDLMSWYESYEHHISLPVNAEGQGPLIESDPDVDHYICFEDGHRWPCSWILSNPNDPNPPVKD